MIHGLAGAAEISTALERRALSSVEVTQFCLARIERLNPRLRAFQHVAAESALTEARASDDRRAKGTDRGPLDGLPIGVKDNIDVVGMPTTGGIGHHRYAMPAADAAVIGELRQAGAVLLGKLNMHEGALGATNDNPWFGRCENPRKPGYTPGGSSGGSGAAVAAGLCAAALGTDTLGSVRVPAAYCGVAGLKPTYGHVSTRGVMPVSWTLDHVGFLSERVEDLRLMLGAAGKYDSASPFARAAIEGAHLDRCYETLEGLRIGRIDRFEGVQLEPEVAARYEEALQALQEAGATLIDVSWPGYDFTRTRREGLLVAEIEASTFHAEALASNPAGFSPELRGMLEFGARQTGTRCALAYRRIAEAQVLLSGAFDHVSVLLLPTTPQVAFRFGEPVPVNQADLTSVANILGMPAGCVPWGTGRDGMPASVQVIGREFREQLVIDVLAALERQAPALPKVEL